MNLAELPKRLLGSMKKGTPVIIQSEAAECGLACMAMVASYHGHALDLPAMRRHFATSLKGMALRDLLEIGNGLHLSTRAVRLELEDLKQLKLPCILHWDHNHFVVLTRVGSRGVTIHDPATGSRTLTMSEVSSHFTGVALEAWPTEFFAKKDERERIHVTEMIKRTAGIGRAALQILSISVLLELVTIAMPIGFQMIIDEVIVASDYDLLTLITIAFCFFLALQVLASFIRSWTSMLIGSGLVLQWKAGLFDHLMRLPLSYFEKRHVGDIVSRFGSVDSIQQTLTTTAITTLLDGGMSIALIIMMWLYGGWLAGIAMIAVVLYTILRVATYFRYRSLSEEAIVYAAKENTHFMESLRGMASLKVMNLKERRRSVWVNYLVDRINANLKVQKFDVVFQTASKLIFGIDRIIIIYLGAKAILGDTLSVGMLIAFLSYKDQFAARMDSFVTTILSLRMLSLHGERIADIALSEPEESQIDAAEQAYDTAGTEKLGRLEIENVSFRYSDNEPDVLKNINITIEQNECVGISGPSGTGKTTLMKIISGLMLPNEGEVRIDGKTLSTLGLNAYRDRIGCVLQDDRLFAGSIAENICSFDPNPDLRLMQQCAMLAAIHTEIAKMPMGYETFVGDMGSTLSGGQRQRIILARALYRRPSLLLLDEATSNLDPENEAAINAAIKQLSITRIVIAHRPSTLAMTDRVIDLKELQDQASNAQ
ncbi:peptidase domain-containing ABC transporter [Halomonas binhaiensis]|uniref:Peptidase domain-containing ABC transporter n=1 Tax=Halomonas binhaiensis TaxID=2562282 RepID=A0A5C1NBG4_9GAMM|nr:peptidase domain-containing ABC transporter [Halomonas binhaiensis]QEM80686.1 peptidase domain-containing ABC transporter [Halomonas binhaiensis]